MYVYRYMYTLIVYYTVLLLCVYMHATYYVLLTVCLSVGCTYHCYTDSALLATLSLVFILSLPFKAINT